MTTSKRVQNVSPIKKMTSLMSTTERDKSHMVQDQMSINCPNFWGWKVNVFLTLRAVRFISRV